MNKPYKYALTQKQLAILKALVDDDTIDICCDKGRCFVGMEKTAPKLVYNLLRFCCLKDISNGHRSHVWVYIINETGRKAVLNKGIVELPFFIPTKQFIH